MKIRAKNLCFASVLLLAPALTTTANCAPYKGVAVVAKSGGDFTTPLTAMNSVAKWCGTPSAANPCLIKIMPGVYDLGTQSLSMRPFVDIEGTGENITVISGSGYSASQPAAGGVIVGANNAELRLVTVKALTLNSTSADANIIAIFNSNASTKITHVSAFASAKGLLTTLAALYNTHAAAPTVSSTSLSVEGNSMGGRYFGVYNDDGSTPSISDTTITATATAGQFPDKYGIYNDGSSPQIRDVTISITGPGGDNCGIFNTGSAPLIENVSAMVTGALSNYGIDNESGSSAILRAVTVRVEHGEEAVAINNETSSPWISNVSAMAYHAAYDNTGVMNYSGSAPYMIDVIASGAGGNVAGGVYNNGSAPVMINVSAYASGAIENTGISNFGASPKITNTVASASKGERNDAIYNQDSSPALVHVSATASDGSTENNGMSNFASAGSSSVITADSSVFAGTTTSIDNFAGVTVMVGASKLNGPVPATGTFQCAGVYDGMYHPLNSSCH